MGLPGWGDARAGAAARDEVGHPHGAVPVTSCADDGGENTLRHALTNAADGDTVDLGQLTCSTITLQSSAISVEVDNLTVAGPGADKLTIHGPAQMKSSAPDGGPILRVLSHYGSGTLTLSGMTITDGSLAADKAYGGCIYSAGALSISLARITHCSATGQSRAWGGGVFSRGMLTLLGVSIDTNTSSAVAGAQGISAAGGGLATTGPLQMVSSTISQNTASVTDEVVAGTSVAYGGGAFFYTGGTSANIAYSTVSGNVAQSIAGMPSSAGGGLAAIDVGVSITASTVDSNTADVAGGAVFEIVADAPDVASAIRSSTVSGNAARFVGGGIMGFGPLTVHNSTIAFNTSSALGVSGLYAGGGTLDLQSSILANNAPAGADGGADFAAKATTAISGAGNLVMSSSAPTPDGTLHDDPGLAPLARNGGPTSTHALSASSVAIDNGNSSDAGASDQRGYGYPRVFGAQADIGAYEFSDVIFADDLELR
jgi:hypothetical protein